MVYFHPNQKYLEWMETPFCLIAFKKGYVFSRIITPESIPKTKIHFSPVFGELFIVPSWLRLIEFPLTNTAEQLEFQLTGEQKPMVTTSAFLPMSRFAGFLLLLPCHFQMYWTM